MALSGTLMPCLLLCALIRVQQSASGSVGSVIHGIVLLSLKYHTSKGGEVIPVALSRYDTPMKK